MPERSSTWTTITSLIRLIAVQAVVWLLTVQVVRKKRVKDPGTAAMQQVHDYSEYYTTPSDVANWPSLEEWQKELGLELSRNAELFYHHILYESENGTSIDDLYRQHCHYEPDNFEKKNGIVGYDLIEEGRGLCMIKYNCIYQFCNRGPNATERRSYNLPAATVKVKNQDDVVHAIQFANRHNIPISIKLSGHNFAGSSLLKDSLNIWMIHYEKDGTINTNSQNSCPSNEQRPVTTVGIGGGELQNDLFNHVRDSYHILSGDTRSVGVAGWLQGVGLSHTARTYGLGVDHVMRFDLVLANGTQTFADECTNPDLFWALKGGGGGTYGVVTHMDYRLEEPSKVTIIKFKLPIDKKTKRPKKSHVYKYLRYWIDVTPNMDTRVGGSFFKSHGFELHILGDMELAYDLFLNDFEQFLDDEGFLEEEDYTLNINEYKSWYDFMGGDEGYEWDRTQHNINESGHGPKASTRLVPHDLVVQDPEYILEIMMNMTFIHSHSFGAYWLGGKVRDLGYIPTPVEPESKEKQIIVTASFHNSSSDGFVYQDDVFRGTDNPSHASGQHVHVHDSFNNASGALQVTVGGMDDEDVNKEMSGGWSYTFRLDEDAAAVYVELDYELTISSKYNADEHCEVRLKLDDDSTERCITTLKNFKTAGASDEFSSVEQGKVVTFVNVRKGVHTLYVGGYNNKKTLDDTKAIKVQFDKIQISSIPANIHAFSKVPLYKSTTAIHPLLRDSIYAITTTTDRGTAYLLERLPDSFSGCSFNHQGAYHQNWRTCLWGQDHYKRLLNIKQKYDPNHRFNCWHCVGYKGPEA